jgi:TPP-dependent pyruvate/acetoin dehydrogenase alpha subunit
VAEALALYQRLLLVRGAEERIRAEYASDDMKTPVHLGIGQEAVVLGVCHALPPGSATFGTYRNHALYLAVTNDAAGFFAELYGRATGPGKGKAGSMHLAAPAHGLLATSAVVATTIPVAVGAALAAQYRHEDRLTAVFFGDGAVEEGVFWESLNFACLRRLRLLFVCEDNELAIHTPAGARRGFRSIPEAAQGFECHVASGEGYDVTEVAEQTRALLARMHDDPRPGLLHLRYFRFLEHVGPREDFEAGYRRRPTAEELERMDPVRRFEKTLDALGVSGPERVAVRDQIEQQLTDAVAQARRAPFAPPAALWEDLFA